MDSHEFFERLQAGERVTCPCCERTAAYNPKTLNNGLCKSLEFLSKAVHEEGGNRDKWWRRPSRHLTHTQASAAALLRHWGLAESKGPVSKARGKDSGWWRITARGVDFVFGHLRVPEKIRLYNGQMIGQPFGRSVTFEQAFKKGYKDEAP